MFYGIILLTITTMITHEICPLTCLFGNVVRSDYYHLV